MTVYVCTSLYWTMHLIGLILQIMSWLSYLLVLVNVIDAICQDIYIYIS